MLAAMLLGSEAVGRAVEMIPDRTIFYRTAHQAIFAAISSLHGRGERADSITLTAELRGRGDLEVVGGPATIAQILEFATTTANLEEHVGLVREAAQKRRAHDLFRQLAEQAQHPTVTALEIVAQAQAEVAKLGLNGSPNGAVEYLDFAAIRATGIPPVPWIVEGWIAEGDVVLFSGDGGIGKSTTVAALAVAVATGGIWCGLPVLRTGPVLVFDEEQSDSEVARIYLRLGAPDIGLRIAVQQGVNLTTAIAQVERELREYRPFVVVFDSVQQVFAGVDGNNAAEVAEVYRQLFRLRKRYGCTFVLLGHLRKPPTEGRVARLHMPLGSVAFGTQASTVWVATQPARDLLDIVQIKRRGADRTSLRTRYASDGPNAPITLTGEGTVDEGETATEKAEDFVLAYLTKHGASPVKWIVAAGAAEFPPLPKRTVEHALKRMVDVLKVIDRPRHGYYAVREREDG